MKVICCPKPTQTTTIPASTCPEDFGQTQKAAFQRLRTGTTKNVITIATTNPNVKATWTALMQATDNTKVTVTPFLQDPQSEPGGPRKFGGGNATLNGIELILGADPSTFAAVIRSARQNIIEAMKTYMCEDDIGVFLINEHGHIAGMVDDITNPTTFAPFPIQAFFVGDKKLGGFEAKDTNNVEWAFPANWSDKFFVVVPTDFQANTDL